MPRKKHTEEEEIPEINLTPIMSILVILIPVLLFAFNFFQLKIQAVQAPRTGKSKKNPDPNKVPLNLTVLITSKGFALTQQSELAQGGKDAGTAIKKLDDGEFDYARLYNEIVKKKNRHPKETVINVGAEPDIPWQVVARTIDATQYYLKEESYDNLKDYTTAEVYTEEVEEKGQTVKKPKRLFEQVVFVVAE